MKKEILYPFKGDEMLGWYEPWYEKQEGFQWRSNEVFEDTITYQTYSRGRSSALLVFRRESNGQRLEFFMTDANDLIPLLVNGKYTGKFTYTKRGTNYATKAVLGD